MGTEEKKSLLERVLCEIELDTHQAQREALLCYEAMLCRECLHQRLVGDPGKIMTKHIPDSLYPLTVLKIGFGMILDLGTGAGLPGIPLKILLPENRFCLLDSRERRLSFLRRVVHELDLQNVILLQGRAEKFGRDPFYRERFDWVVARAVGRASVLAELALPFLAPGGRLLVYKGSRGRPEMELAAVSLAACGGEMEQKWCYRLPSGERRSLFLVRKIHPTPSCYPRRAGVPSKKPIDVQGNNNH